MISSNQYYMLVGSLPAMPRHYDQAERLPISQIALQDRLRMLSESDAQIVDAILDFLVWERLPADRTDEEVFRHYLHAVNEMDHRFACELLHELMNLRTVVGSLRRRRLGLGPFPPFTPLAETIELNWKHPDFRLGARYRWIPSTEEILTSDQPFALGRTLLNYAWAYARKQSERFQFSLEAVIVYLLRWEIIYRWTNRDAAEGRDKFESLVTEAMGQYANLFE